MLNRPNEAVKDGQKRVIQWDLLFAGFNMPKKLNLICVLNIFPIYNFEDVVGRGFLTPYFMKTFYTAEVSFSDFCQSPCPSFLFPCFLS